MIELIICSTVILWLAFIALMSIVDGIKKRVNLNWYQKVSVVAFVLLDLLHNYIVAPFIFFEFASNKRKLLTARLKELVNRESIKYVDIYWRIPIALFMCKYMIEPWDWNHCGLQSKGRD